MLPQLPCAEAAEAVGEPLAGTAPHARAWLLFEFTGRWDEKPLPALAVPDAVRERLLAFEREVPLSRVQLIRRPGPAEGPRRLFVGVTDPREPWLLEWQIDSPDALLDLDLDRALATGAAEGARRVEEPLHLVCTHGRRDRCCALRGMAVFGAMHEAAPAQVWQASHVGGHRYAANVVSFPHGLYYGRVDAASGPALVAAHARGELWDPAFLRGRAAYDEPTQAAEIRLLGELGWRDLVGPRHLSTVRGAGGAHQATFEVAGAPRARTLRQETLGLRPPSCGKPEESAARWV